jgi:hypothetical protein
LVVNDRLLLPILQLLVTRGMNIVLVGFAVAVFSLVELSSAQVELAEESPCTLFGAFYPVIHMLDDLASDVVGNQSSL